MPNDLVLCPPDRQVLVDYLTLQAVLRQEVAQCGSAAVLPLWQQVLLLLELITHQELMADARLVRAGLAHAKPMITQEERAAALAQRQQEQQHASEQQLLESVMALLLDARYFPLTSSEWDIAQKHQFTFDIPVRIDWQVLDDHMLTRFWDRQAAPTTTSSSSSTTSTSTTSSGGPASPHITSLSPAHRQLLDRAALPDFSSSMLVFHRGVGVSSAEGRYLDKKLDLLLDYTLVGPVTGWIHSAKAALTSALRGKQATAQQPSRRTAARAAAAGPAVLEDALEAYPAGSGAGDGGGASSPQAAGAGVPFASSDLSHAYVRVVARRSLRSLMPGPREVLAQWWNKLVLLEPTFREVVVIYRASDKAAAGEPGASVSATQAAESAVTAAVYASSGAAAMAVDAAVEAAKAAAEAGSSSNSSSSSSSSKDRHHNQQQEQQEGIQQQQEQQLAVLAAAASTSDSSAQLSHAARRVVLNPSNVCIKSFSEIALADLELVFPSKQAEVLPTTLVRSALTAAGAIGAAVAWTQQMSHLQWSLPVVVPAAGVVAGRAIKVLSTIKSHQASLNSIMMRMQYEAARDSQEGVVVKLIDELREQHLKEAALALTLMLVMQDAAQQRLRQHYQQQEHGEGGVQAAAVADAAGDRPLVFGVAEIDAACEEFLLQKFGLKIDFIIHDTLPRMVSWGLLQQVGPDKYSLAPLAEARDNLEAFWQAMQRQHLASGTLGYTSSSSSNWEPGGGNHQEAAAAPTQPTSSVVSAATVQRQAGGPRSSSRLNASCTQSPGMWRNNSSSGVQRQQPLQRHFLATHCMMNPKAGCQQQPGPRLPRRHTTATAAASGAGSMGRQRHTATHRVWCV